ncbi:MAG: hypothetical protein J3K34DRAFT_392565 [Monoraphidium minutum]|nr:MAG: hypothetical protein J3K34DRAFT_392565 [Monoraphidium minutum]
MPGGTESEADHAVVAQNPAPDRGREEACLIDLELRAVAAACPNLRHLSLTAAQMQRPVGAALEHLALLRLRDCTARSGGGGGPPIAGMPAPDLRRALPRLAELDLAGHTSPFCAGLFAGHPSVRELRLYAEAGAEDDNYADAWLWAATHMPALESLETFGLCDFARIEPGAALEELEAGGASELDDEDARAEGAATVLHRTCFYLSRCTALTSLVFAADAIAGQQLCAALACIGSAAGPRLRSLTIRGFDLPQAECDAERVLHALPLFPCLEELHLDMSDTREDDEFEDDEENEAVLPSGLEERVCELLDPLPALRQHCPELRTITLHLPDWMPPPGANDAVDGWRDYFCAAHPGLDLCW